MPKVQRIRPASLCAGADGWAQKHCRVDLSSLREVDYAMSLPAKLRKVSEFYGLVSDGDWQSLTAADVLVIPDVGRKTLDRLRLYLAHRGLRLSRDNPPEYWLEHLGGPAEGDDQPTERSGTCPFTILIDTNETFPFTFESITDAEGNSVNVPTRREPLYTRGLADYTIAGFEKDVAVERKGDDLPSSLAQRRENFEAEIANLDAMCEFAAIVVEHEWSEFVNTHPGHGASPSAVARTWLSWSMRYPTVRWFWCPGREAAEQITFWLLERFWWHKTRYDSRRKMDARTHALLNEKV